MKKQKVQQDQRIIDIGLAIGYWRRKRGLRQEDLAERIEISVDSIKSYEQGRRIPRLANLLKIADVLEVDLKDLIRVDDEKR